MLADDVRHEAVQKSLAVVRAVMAAARKVDDVDALLGQPLRRLHDLAFLAVDYGQVQVGVRRHVGDDFCARRAVHAAGLQTLRLVEGARGPRFRQLTGAHETAVALKAKIQNAHLDPFAGDARPVQAPHFRHVHTFTHAFAVATGRVGGQRVIHRLGVHEVQFLQAAKGFNAVQG